MAVCVAVCRFESYHVLAKKKNAHINRAMQDSAPFFIQRDLARISGFALMLTGERYGIMMADGNRSYAASGECLQLKDDPWFLKNCGRQLYHDVDPEPQLTGVGGTGIAHASPCIFGQLDVVQVTVGGEASPRSVCGRGTAQSERAGAGCA